MIIIFKPYKLEINENKMIVYYIIGKKNEIYFKNIKKIEVCYLESMYSGPYIYFFNNNKKKINISNFKDKDIKKIYCFLKRQNIDIKFYGGDNQDPRKPRKINCDEILKDEHNFEY